MQARARPLLSALVAATSAAATLAWASTNPELPVVHREGPVAYVTGGSTLGQERAMQDEAAQYPLELQFLWGRGAKETPVTVSHWSIRDGYGHEVAAGKEGGPILLASLPDGRYVVSATYDGNIVNRVVRVSRGVHDDVLLEWPQ